MGKINMLKKIVVSFFVLILTACGSETEIAPRAAEQVVNDSTGKFILVTGVTGRQGGAVARALLEKGYRVRGMTRNPDSDRAKKMSELGIELVQGDFDNVASLAAAMEGVYGVFSMTNFWEHGYETEVQHGKNTVDAARQAGIGHFIYTSVANADLNTGIPHFDSKYEVEKYIHTSGLTYTILRPVSFMENWEYRKQKIQEGKIVTPFSESTRIQQISVRDIGRLATLAFDKPEDWGGESLDIAGDEFTMKQAQNLFSAVSGSPVELEQISWEHHRQMQGEEMVVMDKWINETGYSANINLVRSYLPELMTLEEYLHSSNW